MGEWKRETEIDTLGLAILLEALNKPCECEARLGDNHKIYGPIERWWINGNDGLESPRCDRHKKSTRSSLLRHL
jgi:hypothetical protein